MLSDSSGSGAFKNMNVLVITAIQELLALIICLLFSKYLLCRCVLLYIIVLTKISKRNFRETK